jgi:hypothetical protein
VVEVRVALVALAVLLLLTSCGSDDDPTAAGPTGTPTEGLWNPCDSLDPAAVSSWFGSEYTMDAGTLAAPKCTFNPADDGDPVIDANYMLFPEGLDAVFDAMTDLDPDDVRVVKVAGADDAKIVVDFDNRQLFVTGFVQNGDLIQTVDVVDPQPYDASQMVHGVRLILGRFAQAAPPSAAVDQ